MTIRRLVSALTPSFPKRAQWTLPRETPARLATSFIVARSPIIPAFVSGLPKRFSNYGTGSLKNCQQKSIFIREKVLKQLKFLAGFKAGHYKNHETF
jgi:hypothetical protein